jgi:glycosyltransferase involved in cell wall biosynthesis
MLSCLELQYGGAITRARVIPNGRNRALFHRAKKDRFILTVGRVWDDAKNLQALERAAPALRWPVLVAGEEEHPGGRTCLFAGLHCLGRLDPAKLARYYARAGIYALPARFEPFGLSVLEAALSGCALVLGDIPSLRESWADVALFVDPEDSLALSATINHLIEDAYLRKRLGVAARLRAQSFTQERMAEEYLSAYRAVAGREALCAS